MYKFERRRAIFHSLFVLVVCCALANGAGILEDLEKSSIGVVNTIENLCAFHSNCNNEFLKLNNYCCQGQCCNIIQFVFFQSEDAVMKNLVYTFDNPRGINIIIGVLIGIVVCVIIGMILSILRCICCGCLKLACCCPSRRYGDYKR